MLAQVLAAAAGEGDEGEGERLERIRQLLDEHENSDTGATWREPR